MEKCFLYYFSSIPYVKVTVYIPENPTELFKKSQCKEKWRSMKLLVWITRMLHYNMCICGPAVLLLGNCTFLRHDQQPGLDLLHITTPPKHNLVHEKHHICLSSWSQNNFWIYQTQRIGHREGTVKVPTWSSILFTPVCSKRKVRLIPQNWNILVLIWNHPKHFECRSCTSLGCPWTIQTIWMNSATGLLLTKPQQTHHHCSCTLLGISKVVLTYWWQIW